MGTPQYMSPEQIIAPGEVDHRADIYALGVVFYQMLTGELPGKNLKAPSKKVQIDVRLDEIVLRALEKNPALRYQQVSEVKTCVETIVATPPGSAGVPPAEPGVAPGSTLAKFVHEPPGATPDGAQRARALPGTNPRFSRTAIVGISCLVLALGLIFPGLYTGEQIARSKAASQMFQHYREAQTQALQHANGHEAHFGFSGVPSIPEMPVWVTMFYASYPFLEIALLLAATIFGWMAVVQIRRSAGKFYGLGLAVFDGLFIPLLTLDGLFAGLVFSPSDTSAMNQPLAKLLTLLVIGVSNFFIIRAVWRAVNKNVAAPANPTHRQHFGLWSAIACAVLLGFFGMVALRHSGGLHTTTKLADSPQDLQKASTARVIAAALENKESPWAWQELERRPLTAAEVAQIMDGLVVWLQQDFPNGHQNPLNWLDNSLERLDARRLLTDEQKIRFLTALQGDLRIEPLPRLHEGDWLLSLEGECSWNWRRDFLGLTMMNGPISVSIDGQPLPPNKNYLGSWTWSYPRINATLSLPALAVGRHIVKVENVSALVAKEDLTGLSSTAPPSDWPPAKKRWNRAVELELNVYPRDAVLVQQTQEPALDPVRNGSLSVNPVIIRSKGSGAQATVTFNLPQKDSVPISFDVALRIGGQTVSCGSLWAVQTSHGETCSGLEQSADLALPSAAIQEADIILTPNPKAIEHMPSVERIWGGQIIFTNIPLKRLDLGETPQPPANPGIPASAASIPPQTGGGQQPPLEVHAASSPGRLVLLAVPVLGLLLILAALVTVLLLALKKSKSGAGKAIAIGCGVLLAGGFLVLLLAAVSFIGLRPVRQRTVIENQEMVQQKQLAQQQIEQAMQATNLSFGPVAAQTIKPAGVINFKFIRVEVPKNSHRIELYFERDANYGLGFEVTQDAIPGPNGEHIPVDFWLQYGRQTKWVGVKNPNVLVWRLPAELSEDEIQAGVKELEQNARRWTKLYEGSNPEFAHIKNREGWTYVLWSHVLREPDLLPSSNAATPNLSFGPVIELTLPEPATNTACVLDLESGRLLTPPDVLAGTFAKGIPKIDSACMTWLRANGADAVLNEPDIFSVRFIEGSAASPNGCNWDSITPAMLVSIGKDLQAQIIQMERAGNDAFHTSTALAPAVDCFVTRAGSMGVMEIRGRSANPPGVRIRYKLVQNGDGKN